MTVESSLFKVVMMQPHIEHVRARTLPEVEAYMRRRVAMYNSTIPEGEAAAFLLGIAEMQPVEQVPQEPEYSLQ